MDSYRNPNVPQQNQEKQKNQEKQAMEKLRETILKLANSEPNVPLTATKNSILQHHLTHFLSCLHTTPDHPPYSWMIEKALQELGEEGGSSEDSISEFIEKEHDSLPWAHMSLLKHHLQKMSEKGEILMVDGGRFLLPGDSKNLNPKRKRKGKRRGNSEIKQKKLLQKEKQEKRVQHDDVEVVREQMKLDEQQSEPSTDKEDGQLSGQQNYVTGNKVNDKPDILLQQSPTGFKAVSFEKSSQTDRAERQLKRWNKSPGEPKLVSTSEVQPLPLCATSDQPLAQMEHPLALGAKEAALNLTDPQHDVHLEQPKNQRRGRLPKYKEEAALNLTDPQHEVHSEQPKTQRRGRLPKYKEEGAKIDDSTISALATNDEVLRLDDPQDEVHLKHPKDKRRGRALKGKEDGDDPDTTLLRDLAKKQNDRGLGRRRKAQ